MTSNVIRILLLLSLISVLTACGGGSVAAPSPSPTPGGWQQGVFLAASSFAQQCDAPRPGTTDVQGSTVDEKNFLRSWSNDTYLWYDQLPDIDPDNADTAIEYFDRLTVGEPTDRFHFTYGTEEWEQLSQGGVSAGYGAEWALLSTTPPREIVVAYTEPASPATNVLLARGARVLAVDGFDIDTNTQAGVDALNNGLFPAALNEAHTFTVLDLGAQNSRQIQMTSTTIVNAMVQNTQVIDTPTGRIGYMTFNFHRAPAESELIDAVDLLNAGQGIDELVLDIRYNGGGFLAIASQLAYMIAGQANTAGHSFETLQFNDKHAVTDPVTGQPITPTPFYNTTLGISNLPPNQPLPVLDLSRVYVLTTDGTCSASEAIMNGLRGADVEVIQIGSQTCGKPYGFYAQDNCSTTYFTIQFRGVNDKNYGDYTSGFRPAATDDGEAQVAGCGVADDYTKQLGDPVENLFEVALAHQAGQGCTTPAAVGPGLLSKPGMRLDATNGVIYRSPFDSNRILRR